MSSNTAVGICSNALLMVGAQTINSFDDAKSDRARLCVNLYPMVSRYVLSSHPWGCTRRRVILNPDVDTPLFDWAYQYTAPPDFLRMQSIGESGAEGEYVIETDDQGVRKILCNDAPLMLRYCWRNENVATWDDLLVTSVTQAMRQVLAYPITQSTSLEQLIDQAIAPILKQARMIDATNQPPETLGDFRLLNSRFSNRGPWG